MKPKAIALALILTLGFTSALLISTPSQAKAETLGAWNLTTGLPSDASAPGGPGSCVVYSSYVYCVGGWTHANTYYASISSSGIGDWIATAQYPIGLSGGVDAISCVTSSNYIYCVGGSSVGSGSGPINTVYYAPMSSSGIGAWKATTDYPTSIDAQSCVTSGGYIYCVGGYSTGATLQTGGVFYAPVSSSGVGAWSVTTSYPLDISQSSCVASAGFIYCFGGEVDQKLQNAVYYAPLSSSGVGAWIATSNFPNPLAEDSACVVSGNSYVYCMQATTTNVNGVHSVYYAPISSSGVGGWTSTSSYPVTDYLITACVASNNYIYCMNNPYGTGDLIPTSSYHAIISSSPTPSLTITGRDTNGNALTGYYTVLYQGGDVVSTGFLPATFTPSAGQTYTIQVDDYGSCHFDHWADTGSTSASRVISISANTQLTAVYNCGTSSASSVTVNSVDQNGNAIFGYYTTLSQGGNTVATGFTTKTFSTTAGQVYGVQVYNYGSCMFTRWANGMTTDPRSVTATSGPTSITAVYNCGGTSTSPTTSTIKVSTVNDAATAIAGYYITLWQGGVQVQSCFSACSFTVSGGQTYQVAAASYGGETFSHWQDGTTGMETVNVPAASTSVQLTATYSP